MVYLEARGPELCCVLDTVLSSSLSTLTSTNELVADFISNSITHFLPTQAPSRLMDAIWLYLHLKRECLTGRDEAVAAAVVEKQAEGRTMKSEKDKGEQEDDPTSCGEQQAAQFTSVKERMSIRVLRCGNRAYLDDLLRRRQETHINVTNNAVAVNSSQQEAAADESSGADSARGTSAALAAIDLALHALQVPKRAQALLRVSSLCLIIRDLEALWCVKYLCKQLCLLQLWRVSALTTTRGSEEDGDVMEKDKRSREENAKVGANPLQGNTGGSRERTTNKREAPCSASGLPLDTYFHDYEVLLPIDFVKLILEDACASASAASSAHHSGGIHCYSTPRTVTELMTLCRTPITMPSSSSPSPPVPMLPSVSLLINPSISPDNNPHRALKNRRVDVIDSAAMDYFYDCLTTGSTATVSSKGKGSSSSAAAGAATSARAARVLDVEHLNSMAMASGSGRSGFAHLQDEAATAEAAGGYGVLTKAQWDRARRSELVKRESYASFLKSASVGADVQLMSFCAGLAGYYLGYMRGASTETCILYAVIGLVAMLLVDTTLLLLRVHREDEGTMKAKRRRAKERRNLQQYRPEEVSRGSGGECEKNKDATTAAPVKAATSKRSINDVVDASLMAALKKES